MPAKSVELVQTPVLGELMTEQTSDRAAALMTHLESEWKQLEAKEADSTIGLDEGRAALLARYESEGLTQREIGVCVKLDFGHINHLLRYHRYLLSTVNKITERTFRSCWQTVRDPAATKGKRKIDADYEAKCFRAIAQMIEQGKKPFEVPRVKEVKKRDIKTLKKFHEVAKTRYEEKLAPTIDKLEDWAHAAKSASPSRRHWPRTLS